MTTARVSSERPSFVAWVRAAFRDPLASNGDYFERLNDRIRSSAPVVCSACR